MIAGPNRPDFDRGLWERQAALSNLDSEDGNLVRSGLVFDELLTATRSRKRIQSLEAGSDLLARTAVALVNINSQYFEEHQHLPGGERDTFVTGEIQKTFVRTAEGQEYAPDELDTSLGDGLRYLLADIFSLHRSSKVPVTDEDVTEEFLRGVSDELRVAVEYDALVGHWYDCAGLSYAVQLHDDVLELCPTNPSLEIARVASVHRRLTLALDRSISFIRWWRLELTRARRAQLCGIRLVRDVTICGDVVEHIDIGHGASTVRRHSGSVEALLEIEVGPYGALLDSPLVKLGDLTLRQLMKGWQFLQSLATKLHEISMSQGERPRSFFSYAPLIRGRVLVSSLSKALGVPRPLALRLLEALTFTGRRSQDLWAQPLVQSGDDFLVVIPCIHAVHFLRVVETWMRQGGLNLDERGPEFERHCREVLLQGIRRCCAIRESIFVSSTSVRIQTSSGVEEEIDIVLIVHDTILLIECKCILWPDDSVQFTNYRSVLEKATRQVERKKRAVSENLGAFLGSLTKLGAHVVPPKRVLACVMTNSAVYAGVAAFGVPIVDMDILGVFLSGQHVSWQIWEGNVVTREGVIDLYGNAQEAALTLEEFMNDPPQLRRVKASIEPRVVSNPLIHDRYRQLRVSTYRVNIDFDRELRDVRGTESAAR